MSDDVDREARGVQLKRRNMRDSLAFLLDSTVDMPAGYDRDTLLMRLEALIREQRALERERCAKLADQWPLGGPIAAAIRAGTEGA